MILASSQGWLELSWMANEVRQSVCFPYFCREVAGCLIAQRVFGDDDHAARSG